MYDSIIIVGATATGKTNLSIEIAKKLNTEIINADSMYIYKDLEIGTAKPTPSERQGIKHHIIDVARPIDDFNVVDYRNAVIPVFQSFKSRNMIPVIVGGTGFYIDSLIKNYSYGNAEHNSEIRAQLNQELTNYGKEYLYRKLYEIDPLTAEKLHMNDVTRIIRALEICLLSSDKKSTITNNEEPILKNPLIIGLTMPRELLYSRIDDRVDIMVKNGVFEEVKKFADMGLSPEEHQSMKGIGYKEIFEYFRGNYTKEEAIEKIKQHTRNYAKRQITWFKRNQNILWFDLSTKIDPINEIINLFYK